MWHKYSNMPEETSCLKRIHVSNKKQSLVYILVGKDISTGKINNQKAEMNKFIDRTEIEL